MLTTVNPALVSASARQPLHHLLGGAQDASGCATAQEAFARAGLLDISFTKEPVFYGAQRRLASQRMLVMHNANGETPLGVVSDRYTVLSNADLAHRLQPLFAQAQPDVVGMLDEGRTTFASFKLADFDVQGDQHTSYLIASEVRGADQALRLFVMTNRLVCSNALASGFHRAAGQRATLRHRDDLAEQFSVLLDLFVALNAQSRRDQSLLNQLALAPLARPEQEAVLDAVYPLPPMSQRLLLATAAGRVDEHTDALHQFEVEQAHQEAVRADARYYLDRLSDEYPVFARTAYAPLCAVTELESTRRTASPSALVERVWFGEGASTSRRAVRLLAERVGIELN